MIGIIFRRANEIVEVRVNGSQVYFKSSAYGSVLAPISSLKLDRDGVVKQFPDLEDSENWKEEALNRLTEKLDGLHTEEAKSKYLIEELGGIGYMPLTKQKQGFRMEKIKWPL